MIWLRGQLTQIPLDHIVAVPFSSQNSYRNDVLCQIAAALDDSDNPGLRSKRKKALPTLMDRSG